MKEEFDLDKPQKPMPYQVPPGFFEGITHATLKEAKRREAATATPKSAFPWQIWAMAASVAVLLAVGYFLWADAPTTRQPIAKAGGQHAPVARHEAKPVLAPPVTPKAQKKIESKPEAAMAQEKASNREPRLATRKLEAGPEESLDNLLASLSDEEVAELAAIAASETYVYEESLQ
ncbi:hypothetical protein ACD591_10835 [Rufibacter glacialis]|uniref:Uncharacterized protein n=1 Tax=Rufibacter glacialis TaxID=1259555 RepID=A0A5M8QA63_9BACT|nr:hypothetical protein [Rufibacter glacialis]KAA6431750.1 hypothetical protein FOE74_16660 [Rufibacter glacialis]GGK81915.1 hypothetical protein GCM10011405_32090 [Rufibacter glacialis]